MLIDPFRFGTSVTDPYISNVSLLLHGNGVNGATTALDNSPTPKTMTANGGAQISTGTKKYGSGSLKFASTGDYFSTPSHAGFLFGSGDWTVEAWLYLSSLPATVGHVVGMQRYGIDNLWMMLVTSAGKLQFYNQINTSLVGAISISTGAWTHLAISRASSTTRIFVDGSADGSVADSHNYLSYSQPLTTGSDSTGSVNAQVIGYIDDVRITKGVARYTSTFTPPTEQFPNH